MDYLYEDNRVYALDESLIMIAEATFPQKTNDIVAINHVFISPRLRGQGKASELMYKVYDYLKKRDLKALPTCPYAVAWFKRHPNQQDILVDAKTLNKSS